MRSGLMEGELITALFRIETADLPAAPTAEGKFSFDAEEFISTGTNISAATASSRQARSTR